VFPFLPAYFFLLVTKKGRGRAPAPAVTSDVFDEFQGHMRA